MDPQVSVFLCRDLDSRISAREVAAVTEWLQSGKEIYPDFVRRAPRDRSYAIKIQRDARNAPKRWL